MTANRLPAWVNEWVSPPVPFAVGGRTRAGADCWGLLRLVFAARTGLWLPLYGGYETLQASAGVAREATAALEAWRPLAPGEALRELDGLLFRVPQRAGRGDLLHVALVVAPGWLLHTVEGEDARVERGDPPRRLWKLLGAYRHAALEAERRAA